jgi:hypothetical protein
MPAAKRSISSRVTIQNPRPRKYASAAERQKALRERFPTLCVRVEQEQADFMKRIADEQGRTLQDVHLAFIKYANGRGNLWLTQGLKGFAPLPRFEETPKENPMKRKPTPAQIAARERFAEMARSGAFKRKAAKARKANPRASNPITETLIYGLAPGETRDYMEELLYGGGLKLTQAQIEQVLKAASAAGYHSFRITGFDPTIKPDFTKALKTGRKRNPRASNPIVLVTDRKPSKRKSNPAKGKRQRMLNISWLTAGGQREIMSVPIEFVFTHYVGNVAEKFFVRTEGGQLIVSEYSTGGRIGQVPYTMRAAALNDREAAKRYVGEMLSKIGAERFKTAVKKFDPIN